MIEYLKVFGHAGFFRLRWHRTGAEDEGGTPMDKPKSTMAQQIAQGVKTVVHPGPGRFVAGGLPVRYFLAVNTIPEATLKAFADHGEIDQTLPTRTRYCDEVLAKFATASLDIDALAAQLQDEGAKSFVKSWKELLASIASKSEVVK